MLHSKFKQSVVKPSADKKQLPYETQRQMLNIGTYNVNVNLSVSFAALCIRFYLIVNAITDYCKCNYKKKNDNCVFYFNT